jgi:large subunit ribosomal protein L20
MARVKRGTTAHKKRERLLKQTKGYRWGRKSKEREARQALMKAWTYSYRDRRTKKRDFRRLWQVKINAAARANNTTYSSLIHALKEKNVALDRKTLADLAENEPKVFSSVVSQVSSGLSGADADAEPGE